MEYNNDYIIYRDQCGNTTTYKKNELIVSTVGCDFLIHLRRKTVALDWSEEKRITISDLCRAIKHRWTYLQEHDTDYGCGDCDGYNYDNCDMYRCKNDCENCGGRRYVCNNGCFYHRYDICVTIEYDNEIAKKELNEAVVLVESILSPNSNHKEILFEHDAYIEQKYEECLFVRFYCSHSYGAVEEYITKYEKMKRKEEDRANPDKVEVIIQEDDQIRRFIVGRNALSVRNHGILPFSRKKELLIGGYDFITDDYCKITIILIFSNRKDKEMLKKIGTKDNIHSVNLSIKNGVEEYVAWN